MSGPNTSDKKLLTRRQVTALLGLAGVGTVAAAVAKTAGFERLSSLVGGSSTAAGQVIPGQLLGASHKVGHILRQLPKDKPARTITTGIAIVGGGISGLSAAYMLKKKGYEDFQLFELENEVGGNSSSGENGVSAHPWGAHYVPLLGNDATEAHELFKDLGIIEGVDAEGRAIYNEDYLCADPHDRLFHHGIWQEGLVPKSGLTDHEQSQYQQFFSFLERLKHTRGKDGKPAFTIPADRSSRDPEFLKYDQITMAEFMRQNGWEAGSLLWYVEYCCRDDYGTGIDQVSAWAGLHYFASRSGIAANADSQTVLTWPEGNGWIVKKLREKVSSQLRCGQLVYNVETDQSTGDVLVDTITTGSGETLRIRAKSAIFAAPQFIAGRVVKKLREAPPEYLRDFTYAPWLVANVTLKSVPPGPGVGLCWDNVSVASRSLGYINATHQLIPLTPGPTVVTYYRPLDERDPLTERREALTKTQAQWAEEVAKDLESMHPSIRREILNIDVWVWGHAMLRPLPGFITGESRKNAARPLDRILFAHSDLSGIPIFEEAHARGTQAALKALEFLSRPRNNLAGI